MMAPTRALPRSAVAAWLLGLVFAALLLPAAPLAAQVEEEDLPEPELAPVAEPPSNEISDEQLGVLLLEAQRTFETDPAAAQPLFDQLIELLELRSTTRGLDENDRASLVRCLLYRTRIQEQAGHPELVEIDLSRLLEWEPGYQPPPDELPSTIERLLGRLRQRLVGTLKLTVVEPPDLQLHVDGRAADASAGTLPVLAGPRWVEAERPGYAPFAQEVEIKADRETPLELILERTSAVVILSSRPAGADVLIDGVLRGTTSGEAPEGYLPEGATARFRREEFSAPLVVADVEVGLRVLEVRKPGYRTYRVELPLHEALDYPMPPIVLDEERGVLVLQDMPPNATLLVDGEARQADDPRAPVPRLSLPPGEHVLQVAQSATRMFTTRFQLADRQTVEVKVRLRPGLALLGILGGDGRRAGEVANSLRLALGDSDKWTVLDRREAAAPLLTPLGISAETLRAGAPGVDWGTVQRTLDREAPGLVYLVGALADDLLATQAELWILAAAPGPAIPDRETIGLGDRSETQRLERLFDQPFALRRPWLGGLIADSDAAAHPLVADVTPGGPLDQAGVAPGDLILSVSQVQVTSGAEVEARLHAAEIGERVEIGVQSPSGARSVRVQIGASPVVYERGTAEQPDAVAFTELRQLEEGASLENLWLIRLNQAVILMRARDWEGAVRLLRDVRAPQVPYGLGQAAADYWLGVALSSLGGTYRTSAVEALRRAAEVEGARLFHNDGPYVAPRARARLLALGNGP